MRKRGNNYIEHLKAGLPPVLTFRYNIILDGRTFARPVNYTLVQILDRRKTAEQILQEEEERRKSRRAEYTASRKRPIIIFDPRAGHGPGMAGPSGIRKSALP